MIDEVFLLGELRQGNKAAFSLLFKRYYRDLVLFGGTFLADKDTCEDIVQQVFLKVWEDREALVIKTSLKSYLLKSVQNACLDEIKHKNVVREHEEYVQYSHLQEYMDTENYILYSDLQRHLKEALEKIPPQYRESFEMNRFKGLKYREIAEKLNVSQRTVEERIGKAIELLRKYLKDFLYIFL
ncbi:MAG: RNA polymerase sigma-70 factor [Tannerella sp.]|jgi:RNA polymerase sigma-70 factor (ECF subfamily)|nr:RNA polymerase sigma-70 factor [Tannerella sp.]